MNYMYVNYPSKILILNSHLALWITQLDKVSHFIVIYDLDNYEHLEH